MNQERNSVMTFTAIDLDDRLPLIYPELIEWDQTSTHDISTFENDDDIAKFLFFDNLETGSNHELHNEAST
jgi:hypothetical protein